MKVLLLGEFSSLYKNLKEGLEELGCDVVIASSGDGYRKIPADIKLSSLLPGFLGKAHRKIKPLIELNKFKGYDVVQVINPFIFYHCLFPNILFYRYLIANNKKLFLSGAGDDAFFWRYGRTRLSYGPFEDFLKYDLKRDNCFLSSNKSYAYNKSILDMSKGLIPIMYEYEVSYQHEEKCLGVIPIPVNLNKIRYCENIVKDKLVVFHGLTRYGFKGTRHVEKAFSYLKSKYPDELELIIEGGLPLGEYLEIMAKTNVVIDQMYSHSLGVNGVYALAMGKVVIGGAEKESLKSHKVTESPVINVKPNYKDLVVAIENLLIGKSGIPDIGRRSREYAEKVHDHVKVAKQYIETWENN